VAAEEVNVIRCFGTFDRGEVFTQRHRGISLDLHVREAIVEFPHPPVDATSARAESLAEPVGQAIDLHRSICAEIAADGPMPASSRSAMPPHPAVPDHRTTRERWSGGR
jgi:hypothetical protein